MHVSPMSAGAPVVKLDAVTICTPTFSRTLVERLDLELPPGGSLLVMGPSGCGKTSLLRAVGGLWSSGEGTITRPSAEHLQVRRRRCPCAHNARVPASPRN